ncbi:MAG TPA: hypothetical protein VN673_06645 [Clostridia bacterium]|nr:hypothetical protein [Clostridia bacterium]
MASGARVEKWFPGVSRELINAVLSARHISKSPRP